jgi:c-di-GMP-binding flagellar brake protein YcgR
VSRVCAITPSQEIANRFRWTPPSTGVIIALVMVFGTVIGILISIYLNSRRKHKLSEQEVSAKFFKEGCERCELTDEEVAALRGIAQYAPSAATRAHEIFDSAAIFERCMEAYVSRTLRASQTPWIVEDQGDILHTVRRKLGYAFLSIELPLMSTRNLNIGQKLHVYPPGASMHAKNGELVRMGEFYFSVRITDDVSGMSVQSGTEMTLTFLRQGDAAYSIPVKVRLSLSGEIDFWHTLKFTRSQNRRYMRLDASLPLTYRVAETAAAGEKPPRETFKARTSDISGGGMCFVAERPLIAGDVILLAMQVPGYSMGGIRARVLRVIPLEVKGVAHYKHLTEFVGIESQQREKIVKYIFEKQREMIQMR